MGKHVQGMSLKFLASRLDCNTHHENDGTRSYRIIFSMAQVSINIDMDLGYQLVNRMS